MILKYDYQYDLAAAIASLALLLIYYLRKSIRTKSIRIFTCIVWFNLIAAILDCVSIFMISDPQKYNLVLNNCICLGYLFFYNCLSILFYLYVDSKAKIPSLQIFNRVISILLAVFYAVVIFSSPWTHWVAYYNEDMVYSHGPVMTLLFVLPFLFFALEIIMFVIARKRFNRYQLMASLTLIFSTAISVVISYLFPRILITQLDMALVLFFVYMAYENPAHFTYQDTPCFDRNGFIEECYFRMEKGKKYSAVAFKLNDYEYLRHTRGEEVANKVSTRVADFLYREFRRNAFVLSDDKFVVFVNDRDKTVDVRNTILNYFLTPIPLGEHDYRVSISHCTIRDIEENVTPQACERLIEYRLSNPDSHTESNEIIQEAFEKIDRENHLLRIIKKALQGDQIQVYFQPIYNVKTGFYESAEALLRIYDEELGFVSPEELVRLAEKNNYISQIGDVVFRKVCQCIHDGEFRRHGIKYIEINLSPIHCKEIDIVERFQNIMGSFGISPSQINLEITETAEFENEKKMMLNIERFNSIGISFSIDDYGSGFASADYLLVLPVSIVKIDKSILWNAMESENAMIVLRNTISMLQELRKHIVVEGVETQEMADVLTELGVDYFQGYLFSKPIPPDEFVAFLEKNQPVEDEFDF